MGIISNLYASALKWFRLDADAQCSLGFRYAEGKGIAKDYSKALKWVRKAAEQSQARAQYRLGHMYAEGKGVPQDDQEAVKWYRKAAEQGEADAQHVIGLGFLWCRKAAEQGHAEAQYRLGYMHDRGVGVPHDYQAAVKWYRKAAEQGHALAQYSLAALYERGLGATQDYVQAYVWLHLAVAQDDKNDSEPPAEERGLGVTQDYIRAYHGLHDLHLAAVKNSKRKDSLKRKMSPHQLAEGQKLTFDLIRNKLHDRGFQSWVQELHKQAESRDCVAQLELGVLSAQGRGVPRDLEKAVLWFRKVADEGDADEALEALFARDIQAQAQCFLAVMCYLGLGVPLGEAQYRQGVREVGKNDHLQAFKWFRKAADKGHAEAQHSLGLLHTTGKRIVRDWSSAVIWFRKAAEQGHAGAQYELGRMYQQGLSSYGQQKFPKGLSSYEQQKDERQVLKWLRKAADQGHAGARHCLGLLYSKSNGLPQDDR